MTAFMTFSGRGTHRLHGSALRRHDAPHPPVPRAARDQGIPVPAGDTGRLERAIRRPKPAHGLHRDSRQPHPGDDRHRRAAARGRPRARDAAGDGGQHFPGPGLPAPAALGADLVLYSATKYLSGFSDMLAGVALAKDPELIAAIRKLPAAVRQHPAAGRVLDAGRPAAHRRAAHEPAEQECAAHRRAPRAAPATCKRTTRRCSTIAEQIRIRMSPVRFSGRLVLARLGRQGRRRSSSCAASDRAQRGLAGRRGDAGLPSQDHHALRA